MLAHGIDIPQDKLAEFCRRHGIARLSLFGSMLRADFRPESDIDVLVEFLPGRTPGLFRFAGMEMELCDLLERHVHLCTPGDLSVYIRDKVLSEARVQYAA
jgi:hypothetical protein